MDSLSDVRKTVNLLRRQVAKLSWDTQKLVSALDYQTRLTKRLEKELTKLRGHSE